MSDMDLEYFKPIEPLGSPGGSASPVKLASALTALAALAVAAASLFFFYVATTAQFIGTNTARVEVQLYNREPGQAIYWMLVQGPPPQTPPVGESELLEEDQTILELDRLEPNTEYTIVFLEYGSDGEPVIVHTFTFVTDGAGNPPSPPPDLPPPGQEDQTPPADQEQNEPGEQEPGEEQDDKEQEENREELPPPPPPPGGTGDSGGSTPPPKNPGEIFPDEMGELNRIDYEIDYTAPLGDTIPVTVTIGGYRPGTYEFRITDVAIRDITTGDAPVEWQQDQDYRVTGYSVGSEGILVNLELNTENMDLDTMTYLLLEVQLTGANYENGTFVSDGGNVTVMGQVNLVPGYRVTLNSLLNRNYYGLILNEIEISTDIIWGESLPDVAPGQTVDVYLGLSGEAEQDFTLSISGKGQVTITPEFGSDAKPVAKGDQFASLFFSFTMPYEDVTEEDLDLQITATEAGTGISLFAVPMEPGAAAEEPAVPGGPNSVGPLAIYDSIHGLDVLSVTFSQNGNEAVQLTDVAPGETVYLNILLQGTSMKSFRLGASFAPSGKLADLRTIKTDDVAITDTDAYLRFAFTMPNSPVTAADFGFRGFTADQ